MAALTLVLSEQGLDPNQFVNLRGHLSSLSDDYRGELGTASIPNSLTDSDRSSGSSSDPRKESDSNSAYSSGINSLTSGTGEISESDEVFSNTINPVLEKFPGGNELQEEKTNERWLESAEEPLQQTMTESTEQPILVSIEQPMHELITSVKVGKKRKNKIHYLGRDLLKLDKNTQPHTWQLTSPLYGFFSPHIFGNYGCYFRFENGSSIEEYPMQKCNDCDFYSPTPYS
ncbi:hypothetical protein TKK_0007290 [Trichogramma kaykai]|uniref:Uncharacterized protein n=1 Tax=Trichogramma kaykai TaxID=54128 RepID=A0ABD2X9L4_9HYME